MRHCHQPLPPSPLLTGRSSAELASGTKMVRTAAGSRCQAAASSEAAPSASVRVSRHARLLGLGGEGGSGIILGLPAAVES